MQINLSEENRDLPHIAAAIGRVADRDLTPLLANLLDVMTASEKNLYRRLYVELEFSKPGNESPL